MRIIAGLLVLFVLGAAGAALLVPAARRRVIQAVPIIADKTADASGNLFPRHPTFDRDIAPLVFANCCGCHHPGGVGPFSLLTYQDVHKHSKEVADLTQRHVMPPWMPDSSCGPFKGERRLSDGQIQEIQRWYSNGMPQGDASDLPAAPEFNSDWELGPPDLLVKLDKPFLVPADGKDVYQNFVIPVGLEAPRTVRAVELRSGNPRVVHHAFLLLDSSGAARVRAAREGGSSYPGMSPGDGVSGVKGEFLSWQPGRSMCIKTDDNPWRLPAGADIVLQAHLRPTGKVESLQPEIALYFTDKPPAKYLYDLLLRSTAIDIPAGSRDYTISASYTLPVDAEVLSVLHHCHYLGKDLQGFATLPDGTRQMLLHIPNWDFFWQGSYRYVTPVLLPKGTTIQMRFTYDNSDQNPNNPNTPPKRVTYGLNSLDEMGEFWVELRARNENDYRTLLTDAVRRVAMPDTIAQLQSLLGRDPNNALFHAKLGAALLESGRREEGMAQLQAALALDGNCAKAHACLGNVLFARNDVTGSIDEFRKAIAADPSDFTSAADLGLALASDGKLSEGVEQLQRAIALNPRDALTHTNLARVYLIQKQTDLATAELQRALQLDPELPLALQTKQMIDSPWRFR